MNIAMKVPNVSSDKAETTVVFNPIDCISPAMNGDRTPSRMMFSDTAPEIVLTLQPNSWCRGTMITPGVDRTPMPHRVATNITASTTQA